MDEGALWRCAGRDQPVKSALPSDFDLEQTATFRRPPSVRKDKGEIMSRVLPLGLDPETVDYSDPALPPGMTAEKVHAGIAVAMRQFAERGWEADVGMIRPDETAGPTIERHLASKSYDCVVLGGGVRLPPQNLSYSKSSSTLFVRLRQARRLPLTQDPTIAPMLPPDGWRLEAGLYRAAKASTPDLLIPRLLRRNTDRDFLSLTHFRQPHVPSRRKRPRRLCSAPRPS